MVAPHLNDPMPVRAAKRALRHDMALLRRTTSDAAALIAAILAEVELPAGAVVAGVWPLPGEPDLRPVWDRLHAHGHAMLLPETTLPGERLRFRRWHPGCAMLDGRFGTRHPATDPLPLQDAPDLVFVPLLAFDRAGYRLGHGGGYYDRTLAALPRARAVGYGFSCQQVEAVPRGPFDLPLSMIVTETGRVPFER